MKWNRDAKPTESPLVSEGKLLEVIPVITDNNGQPFMLPPVIWQVPNWLLGYRDDNPMSMPMQLYMNERLHIPGSNSSRTHGLWFLVRVLEDSPSAGVTVATVDADACAALLQAIRESVNRYN